MLISRRPDYSKRGRGGESASDVTCWYDEPIFYWVCGNPDNIDWGVDATDEPPVTDDTDATDEPTITDDTDATDEPTEDTTLPQDYTTHWHPTDWTHPSGTLPAYPTEAPTEAPVDWTGGPTLEPWTPRITVPVTAAPDGQQWGDQATANGWTTVPPVYEQSSTTERTEAPHIHPSDVWTTPATATSQATTQATTIVNCHREICHLKECSQTALCQWLVKATIA